MTRAEMVDLRNAAHFRVEECRHVGDYGAGAKQIREIAETQLKLIDHLLERRK